MRFLIVVIIVCGFWIGYDIHQWMERRNEALQELIKQDQRKTNCVKCVRVERSGKIG